MIAKTKTAPYYAVIFTSLRTPVEEGYSEMANRMVELAQQQPGFLGVESARSEVGITISYWDSIESIKSWKNNTQHRFAQNMGKSKWYQNFAVRICKVESDYFFEKE